MVSRWQPHCVVVSSASSSCAWLGASACCKSSEWHFSGVVAQAALKPNRWRLKVRVSICFVLFWGLFLALFWCFLGLELLLRSTVFFLVWVEEHFGWKLQRKFFFFFFFFSSSGYERFEWNFEYLYSVGIGREWSSAVTCWLLPIKSKCAEICIVLSVWFFWILSTVCATHEKMWLAERDNFACSLELMLKHWSKRQMYSTWQMLELKLCSKVKAVYM